MLTETIPAKVRERILSDEMLDLVMSAEDAASMIRSGMTLCTSGFGTGYPKAIPTSLSETKHATGLTLINGAARGEMHLGAMAGSGILKKFSGFLYNEDARNVVNAGGMAFADYHLGQLSTKIKNGVYGKIDYAIIECCKIREDGSLVPTLSAGITESIVKYADKILIELNLSVPAEVEGFHDFGVNYRTIINSPADRLGVPYIQIDTDKVAGIVITDFADTDLYYPEIAPIYNQIAGNVVAMLDKEIGEGRLPEQFTFQSGMGVVANCVMLGLMNKGYKGLKMYTEVLSDQALYAIKEGIIEEATTTALDITPLFFDDVFNNLEFYKKHLVLRPVDLTNGVAQIAANELVSMNTAWETDIYGNVNSSHAMGTQMINGLGGSNDFSRNSKISVFTTPSTAKHGLISCIVPMVPHVDSTEHDVDVIATEWGYADLRGKSPKERASLIIENCAHPDYRQQLRDYFNGAVELCGPCQTPHDLSKALSWHQKYLETGSMRQD
ncbi:MAG: acetyl-CoA hydrolase/transferase C-terminal domain-containing protein [Oscillospiraceae bacterium]|nr:acetyl-CoA hydrolase/transferase C-terminal domain-containing protein [Oscillospiraceae bacterium]